MLWKLGHVGNATDGDCLRIHAGSYSRLAFHLEKTRQVGLLLRSIYFVCVSALVGTCISVTFRQ